MSQSSGQLIMLPRKSRSQEDDWTDSSRIEAQVIPPTARAQVTHERLYALGKELLENWDQRIPLPVTTHLDQAPSSVQQVQSAEPSSDASDGALDSKTRDRHVSFDLPRSTASTPPAIRESEHYQSDARISSTPSIDPCCCLHLATSPDSDKLASAKLAPRNCTDSSRLQALYRCSEGEYPCLWYKFRRFESLSLFNLYILQDRVVRFEIYLRDRCKMAALSEDELSNMNDVLKEYHESLIRFKEISQMKRPPMRQRKEAAQTLVSSVSEDYDAAPDSLGMVDLIPTALGVEADPIRVFVNKTVNMGHGQDGIHTFTPGVLATIAARAARLPDSTEKRVPGANLAHGSLLLRPSNFISTSVDSMARIVVAFLAALFLIAPMLALSYIYAKWARLLASSLFILFFCVVASAAPQARNHEVIMMTAAYAAVLVVFVGQTA